ncbi:MAG TPA: hypothetical protein VHM91_01560 [Verrucomicrobiales bacterium]|jgi:hypothetical protein|nr:hypothetical protein [Verrucomicrobiales bacterium]
MNELLSIYIPPLNKAGFRYMITGSVSSMFYGETRLTSDVDIVLNLRRDQARHLVSVFPGEDFYVPPPEVIEAEIARRQRGHLNILHHHTNTKADIYLFAGDPFQAWAFDHAVPAQVEGIDVWFTPPEYTILSKLEFYREGGSEKHLRDIHGILATGERIRAAEVSRFVEAKDLSGLWQRHVLSKLTTSNQD